MEETIQMCGHSVWNWILFGKDCPNKWLKSHDTVEKRAEVVKRIHAMADRLDKEIGE